MIHKMFLFLATKRPFEFYNRGLNSNHSHLLFFFNINRYKKHKHMSNDFKKVTIYEIDDVQ